MIFSPLTVGHVCYAFRRRGGAAVLWQRYPALCGPIPQGYGAVPHYDDKIVGPLTFPGGTGMSVYTREDLKVMQAWPLERKIQVTQAKILEWYYHYGGNVAVSYSAGKDNE